MSRKKRQSKRETAREAEAKQNRKRYKHWREVMKERMPARASTKWIQQRNHLVCVLLDKNKTMTRGEALRRANQVMHGKMLGGNNGKAEKKAKTECDSNEAGETADGCGTGGGGGQEDGPTGADPAGERVPDTGRHAGTLEATGSCGMGEAASDS